MVCRRAESSKLCSWHHCEVSLKQFRKMTNPQTPLHSLSQFQLISPLRQNYASFIICDINKKLSKCWLQMLYPDVNSLSVDGHAGAVFFPALLGYFARSNKFLSVIMSEISDVAYFKFCRSVSLAGTQSILSRLPRWHRVILTNQNHILGDVTNGRLFFKISKSYYYFVLVQLHLYKSFSKVEHYSTV